MSVVIQEIDIQRPAFERLARLKRLGFDLMVMGLMVGLLIVGAWWQIFWPRTDVAKYHCYAVQFWEGMPALNQFSKTKQCDFLIFPKVPTALTRDEIVARMQAWHFPTEIVQFVAHQNPNIAGHALPREYPLVALAIFSLGMFSPIHWYQVVYAIFMAMLAIIMYLVLVWNRSRKSAVVFAIYLVLGGWATAVGRFDLVPAAFTLFAVVAAMKGAWKWGYTFLAIATLAKFYPVALLLPFFIGQQQAFRTEKWYALRRWLPLGLFCAICVGVVLLSLSFRVEGTLAPVTYLGKRPIQVETLGSSLLWLSQKVTGNANLRFVDTYGSLNVLSNYMGSVETLLLLMTAVGIGLAIWFQWSGKLNLAQASLLYLLVIIITGKVFSPQYVIWIIPLLAYVGEDHPAWVVPWALVCFLTTWNYPFIYEVTSFVRVPTLHIFYPVLTARNLLFLTGTIYWFVSIFNGNADFLAKEKVTINTVTAGPIVVKQDQTFQTPKGGKPVAKR